MVRNIAQTPLRWMQAFLQTLAGQRLFTSHLPLLFMPDFSAAKGKYIYVARILKDTAVSFYFHDRSKNGYEGSWEEHLTFFMQGQVMYGSYFDNLLPWVVSQPKRSEYPLFEI